MKAAVLTGIRQMEITDVPEPVIEKPNEVLVRIKVVGVCGSDVHYYVDGKIGSQIVEYPYRVGHECSGIVEKVGSEVTHVKPGDEVVVNPAQSCYQCDQCLMGRENTCRNLKFLGTPGQGPGCLCEYLVMNQRSLFNITGKMSLATAALCEPFTIGLYSVLQAGISGGEKIAILGSGPIGLSCLVAAKSFGIETAFVTDKIEKRTHVALSAGAFWASNPDKQNVIEGIYSRTKSGVDVAFECAGEQSTLDEAVEVLRPGGTLVIVGIPRTRRVSFSIDRLRRKEISIVNIRRQNQCDEKAIELVSTGKANIDFMITHTYSLEDTKTAFDLVESYSDGVIKAMIEL